MITNFEDAFSRIKDLVNDFDMHKNVYLSVSYSEARVREDFINKFFFALGWDVTHEYQKNPYEQEVKVEPNVDIGAHQRRADYAFLIAPNFRDPRLFAEAKKPFGDIVTKQNCFQIVRYGWNAQTSIGILINFDQLVILDCRYKPDIETSIHRVIKRYHFKDYINEEKFASIYYLFSRNSVSGGSLEKYSDTIPAKRGKSIQRGLFKGGWQQVDDSFLVELDEYREELARSFKNCNKKLDGDTLTEITQRTLDRLVFIRFLEDKIIEPKNYVANFGDKGTAWEDFISICKQFDKTYNGIIFKDHTILDSPTFKIDNSLFSDICEKLAHINSPYDFNYIPIHILGSIYERFLGKVIVVTDKDARLEEKLIVRKAGGVYYTPEYIVRYIIENTVGKMIDGKSPAQILAMKFADISCGSGSFLISIYDYLLKYHTDYYNNNPNKIKHRDCSLREDGYYHLTLGKKRSILINNIYGVDIDSQAAEVAQLSLYLKLLEDETTASTHDYQLEFKETLLPSLNRNIICGNSIIDTEFYSGNLYISEEDRKANAMDFEVRFPKIMQSGGFDAIVGNPPYILLQDEFRNDKQLEYFKNKYISASFKIDTYHLFIERAVMLTKNDGMVSLITPANYLTNNYLNKLRNLLIKRSSIEKIIIVDGGVFNEASVDTSIIITKIGDNTKGSFKIMHADRGDVKLVPKSTLEINVKEILKDKNCLFTGSGDIKTKTIWEKVNKKCIILSEIAAINFGKQLRDRKKYTKDVIEVKNIKEIQKTHIPCITGRDVDRYIVKWNGLSCLNSQVARRGGCWDPERHNAKNKLLTRQIGKYPSFGLEKSGYHCLNTLFMVNRYDENVSPYFILGFLNSALIRFLWLDKYYDQRTSFPKIKGTYLKKLPIPDINIKNKENLDVYRLINEYSIQLVDAKERMYNSETDKDKDYYENLCIDLDHKIDSVIYNYFKFNPSEIKIIETSH